MSKVKPHWITFRWDDNRLVDIDHEAEARWPDVERALGAVAMVVADYHFREGGRVAVEMMMARFEKGVRVYIDYLEGGGRWSTRESQRRL